MPTLTSTYPDGVFFTDRAALEYAVAGCRGWDRASTYAHLRIVNLTEHFYIWSDEFQEECTDSTSLKSGKCSKITMPSQKPFVILRGHLSISCRSLYITSMVHTRTVACACKSSNKNLHLQEKIQLFSSTLNDSLCFLTFPYVPLLKRDLECINLTFPHVSLCFLTK